MTPEEVVDRIKIVMDPNSPAFGTIHYRSRRDEKLSPLRISVAMRPSRRRPGEMKYIFFAQVSNFGIPFEHDHRLSLN